MKAKAKVKIEDLGFDTCTDSLEYEGFKVGTKRFFGQDRDRLASEWINKVAKKVDVISWHLERLPYFSITQVNITFKLNG